MNLNVNFCLLMIRILIITSMFFIPHIIAQPKSVHPNTTDILTGRGLLGIEDSAGNRHLEGYIWYPTLDMTTPEWAHGNSEAVWEPIHIHPEATPMEGKLPLVVLSHGSFGTAHNQAWLAEALVRHGFMVAAIHHPGTSHFFRDPVHRKNLWQRADDISRVIDYLTTDFIYADHINQNRIYMAGHSLGGFTAMLLAGARYDAYLFNQFCSEFSDDLVCRLFSEWRVAQTSDDIRLMEKDWSDDRIKAFAIFDLGGTQSFSHESLEAIDTPLLVYGAPVGEMKLNLDIESRYLVEKLSPETVRYIEPQQLGHFDFLAVCTEHAFAVLNEVDPDDLYVCENGRAPRQQMHERIAEEVLEFFLSTTHEHH